MYCSICQGTPLIDALVMDNKWKHLEPNRLFCGHWTTLIDIIQEGNREICIFNEATFNEEEQIKMLVNSARRYGL
jgi:hypothetical protein